MVLLYIDRSFFVQTSLKLQRNSYLLTSLMSEMPPSIKMNVSSTLLAAEILPILSEVISPTFRPVRFFVFIEHEC